MDSIRVRTINRSKELYMATATVDSAVNPICTEPVLTQAIVGAVNSAITMCAASAKCVGISSVPAGEPGRITGMIGVHGRVSGFITLNLSERMAIRLVGGLLQDEFGEVSSQVVDGAGEITNIVVGGIKSGLVGTPWSFSHMTVPSVIVGEGYQIAYARGLAFACVSFEHDDAEAVMLQDRIMKVSISLLKL